MSTNLKRRLSSRKSSNDDVSDQKRLRRPCEKAGCGLIEPTCCLLSSEFCVVSNHTSRWYHMSPNEHFCNNCFDHYYRTNKTGNKHFSQWSHTWGLVSRANKPTIKGFVANELLPYWLKCSLSDCGKWRQVRKDGILSSEFVRKFCCSSDENSQDPCSEQEDSCVSEVLEPSWMELLTEPPLLKNSPAGPYLKRFLAEDLGLCPLSSSELSLETADFIIPFREGQGGESPIWLKPDKIMHQFEIDFLSQSFKNAATYLGIRNLIVTLWNYSPKEWLTVEKVSTYIICRGLCRIYVLSKAAEIIELLSKKAVINYGLVTPPDSFNFIHTEKDDHILVIGAGVSGLTCARHLKNLGVKVSIAEAKNRIGGRICDELFVGTDTQILKGIINNPFIILATQANKSFEKIKNDPLLFFENGSPVPETTVKRVHHIFSGIMHGAIEWANEYKEDSNWYDVISKNLEDCDNTFKVSKNENYLLNFYLRYLEVEMGISLKNLTLLNWEFNSVLFGEDALFPDGLMSLLKDLAGDLDISYNSVVKTIDYTNDNVIVTTEKEKFTVSKVIVTVPISAMKKNLITFHPPLSTPKIRALNELDDAICEKIVLMFDKKFWKDKISENYKKFGIVTKELTFQVFVDVSSNYDSPTLVSYVTEIMKDQMKGKSDEDFKKMCINVMKKIFKNVPEPTKWFLTHWGDDTFCSSYGSYVKVLGSQNAYDDLSLDENRKIYFAGDATFRNCPSTVTGAFFSGLREAVKVIDHLENN